MKYEVLGVEDTVEEVATGVIKKSVQFGRRKEMVVLIKGGSSASIGKVVWVVCLVSLVFLHPKGRPTGLWADLSQKISICL
jgi:hypothetical protein